MKCETCLESKLKLSNPFVSEPGCTNWRTSSLTRHEQSADHRHAVVACRLKIDMAVAVERAFNEKDAAIIKLMQIVYYIAKQELAISKFESLIELMTYQVVILQHWALVIALGKQLMVFWLPSMIVCQQMFTKKLQTVSFYPFHVMKQLTSPTQAN